MRPVNLFLTEDGVLKLGYYGLTTQAECFSIKKKDCEGVRSFALEVFRGEYEMKSDVWSLGIALMEMMGITPISWCEYNSLSIMRGGAILPFDNSTIESAQLIVFLNKCFLKKEERYSVNELLSVSVLCGRMMSSIHL